MVVPFEPFGRSKPTTVRRLPGLLQDGERLLAFAQAHHARAMRSRVLALTDRRLIMLARSKDEAVEISLERVTSAKLVRLRLVDSKLTVQTDAGPLKFTNIFPAHQGERMATLLGNADRAEERFASWATCPSIRSIRPLRSSRRPESRSALTPTPPATSR